MYTQAILLNGDFCTDLGHLFSDFLLCFFKRFDGFVLLRKRLARLLGLQEPHALGIELFGFFGGRRRRGRSSQPRVHLAEQVGQVAQKYMGWAYKVLPSDRLNMKQQLALGRPLIVGVRTHGLGNPNYPGYRTHYEQPGYSVSHYLVVIGYDTSDNFVLNDPGLTKGRHYYIKFDQLMHAIDDLDQAYPSLNSGRVFVVMAPFTSSTQ